MKHSCVTLSISIAVIAGVLVLFGYLYVIPQPQHNAASTPCYGGGGDVSNSADFYPAAFWPPLAYCPLDALPDT